MLAITIISSFLEQSDFENIDNNYKLAKAIVVFGTIYLSSWGMDTQHREHKMPERLLSNLEQTLQHLDRTYEKLKTGKTE